MVLESIIKPADMEKTPRDMLYVGFIYSTIGLLLAFWIFGSYSSLAGVFLTTMPLLVIMYKTLRLEEEKDKRIHEEAFLIKEHGKALSFFMFLFLGMVISYSLWFTVLPEDVTHTLFSSQTETIRSINPAIGNVIHKNSLGSILYNNFMVLAFCILFSFLYGSGAIFILTWNASVIGVAVGSIIRNSLANYTSLFNYFGTFSITFAFMVHGIPEISAYFLGALGGGIISVAVVNHDIRSREFKHIVIDSVDLIILSCLVLLLAGAIEVFVTPMFF